MSMDADEGGKGKQAVMACPFRLELKDVMMDLGLRPRDMIRNGRAYLAFRRLARS